MRRTPELTFDYDDTLEKEIRIEQLLDQIKTEHVAGRIKPGEDSPLKVLIVIQVDVRTHCHPKPDIRLRGKHVLHDRTPRLAYGKHQEAAVEQLPFFDSRIDLCEIELHCRRALAKHGAARVEDKLAADMHREGCEVERIERSKRQEPHMVFRLESLPDLAQHGSKVSRVALGPDQYEHFREGKLTCAE